MVDADKIREDGVKLLEEFSNTLRDIPEKGDTHYVIDMKNVWREDDEPVDCEGFSNDFLKLAPNTKDNYIVTEAAEK